MAKKQNKSSIKSGSHKPQFLYNDGGNLFFLGGLTGAEAVSGGGGIAGEMSGMIGTKTKSGGAISGALKGASMGATLGPWGMAAGSILGGAAGLISSGKAQNEAETSEFNSSIQQRNQLLGIRANGGYIAPLGVSPNMMQEYAEGGMLTEFNTGSSHESNPNSGIQQGIGEDGQANRVEEGETKYQDYIFSDRLKIDKQAIKDYNLLKSMEGKTFADISKKMSKLHKERPNDPITRDTMKSNMSTLMAANDDVRVYQEGSMMASGGQLYPKGGFIDFEDPRQMDRYNNPLIAGNPIETLGLGVNSTLNTGMERDKLNEKVARISAMNLNDKTKLGYAGDLSGLKDSKALRYAPIAFDALAATGLFGKSPKPQQYSPTLIQQQGRLSAPQIDEQGVRAGIDAAYQNQIRGLADASGGSNAALRAGLVGSGANYMSAIGQGFLGANSANQQAKMQADQYNLGTQGNVATQNAQLINHAGMYNNQNANLNAAQNWDTRMSYLGKGAEGLGDIGYEERMREIMPRIYGYTDMAKYASNAKACGGRLKMMRRNK